MQLPGVGGVVLLQQRRFEARGDGGDGLWTGTADGRADSDVLLTVKNGFMAGTIRHGADVYEVRPTADGHVVERIDFNTFPACAGGQPARDLPVGGGAAATEAAAAALGRIRGVGTVVEPTATAFAAGDPVYVDVMSVYTPQARAAAGGTAQIETVIQAAVDASNEAFANSNIVVRYRLVKTAEVTYNDTGDIAADLEWVNTNPDVAALRNQYGADLVSLMVNDGGRYCGVGYVMRTVSPAFAGAAFQVTVRACAVTNLSFAHEHGHNLGLEHDPANSVAPNEASYPWSFGYFVDSAFRTVMSYATVCSSGCRRIPYYSNPDVSYLGYPTGVANAFDNARTADLTASLVANFRTAPVAMTPAIPTGLNAAAPSAGQVNLTWGDASGNETGFKIERSTAGGAYTQIAALGANFVSFADLSVSHSTSYAYRIRAYNANGDSGYSNVATITTPLPPAPVAPNDLVASVINATQVNLAWVDNSGNETGFEVERSANGAGFVEVVSLPAGTTSFPDSSASPSTNYQYRVRAVNAGGNSSYSNTASATTPAASGNAPSAPSGLAATAASSMHVGLVWGDTSSNETGFKVERSADGGPFVQIGLAAANVSTYLDVPGAGASFAYRVRATNASGDSAYSNVSMVSMGGGPSAPAGLSAVAASATQVNLSWTDTSSNETGFKVERSADGGGFAQIATVSANVSTYADTSASGGVAYAYRVRASNASGDSGYSNIANVTTAVALPSAPAGLSAVAASATQVNLSWTDTSSNETGF
ncbi:MAG: fibronectin type III domain-containing protein, partial [Bryobacterales bacterium]|nr:fibronectin type III domain-containing protein [Bryobacterales bacterium]